MILGGGRAKNIAEKTLLNKGTVAQFLFGDARGLTTRDLRLTRSLSPQELVDDVFLRVVPLTVIGEENDYKWPVCKKRISKVVDLWSEGDLAKKAQLFNTIAAHKPLVVDTHDLVKLDDMKSLDDEIYLEMAFARMFSREWFLGALDASKASIFEGAPDAKSLAPTRRIITALADHIDHQHEENGTAAENNPVERQKAVDILLPYTHVSLLPASTQENIAEIIMQMTPRNEQVDFPVLWLGLLSSKEDVGGRASDNIALAFKIDNSAATELVAEQAQITPVDYEHRGIWYNLNKIVSKLKSPPGDKLFSILKAKLMAEDSEVDQLHHDSVGPICGILDQILSNPQNEKRKKAIISEDDSYGLAKRVLDLYLDTDPNPNTWNERTQMLNLVENLVNIHPQIVLHELLESQIENVMEQQQDAYSQHWIIENARLYEDEAALCLVAYLDSQFERFSDDGF